MHTPQRPNGDIFNRMVSGAAYMPDAECAAQTKRIHAATVLAEEHYARGEQAQAMHVYREHLGHLGEHSHIRPGARFDYGVNTTDFGKYMNGHTRYEHTRGTSDFAIKGRGAGSAPNFWVMRLDLGKADTNVPHSWNAFIDYKRFEHGSFFGGNGTGYLPDRYLDGIRSFSVGAGYVPVENLLVEAFYTFDAKGIGSRDTLYGGEKFTLGNYAGMRLTYNF